MSLARAIATVGGFTMLSRVAGFVRDMVLSAVLGGGAIADAFFVAFKLPNFFRRLFAEGAFSAAFVPIFAREMQAGGRDAAIAFAREAQAAFLLVLLPFVIVLVIAMPWVMRLLAPGLTDDPTFALAIDLGRICFPYLLFISLVSLHGGVLNGIERFAHVAATPILLNLAIIAAVLGLTPLLPNGGYAAAIGVTLAGLLQWLWLVRAAHAEGVGVGFTRPRWTARVRRLVTLATPVAVGGGVQQISLFLDVVWASLLPAGAISALYYADRVAQLPLGVVGVAIGTALLPMLARQLRAGENDAAMANQNRALEFGFLLALPAAVALWVLAEPLVRMLFERGRFGNEDAIRAGQALAAFAIGLPAFVAVKGLTPGFFAREDTRTPLYIALAAIAANVALNIFFLKATSLGAAGIALASSIAGWLNAVALAVVLIARGHWVADGRLFDRGWRILAASAGMGGFLWFIEPHSYGGTATLGLCVSGAALYGAFGIALGILRRDEIVALFRRSAPTAPPSPPA
ncbi:MAG: murein biosynthesis integral membrane protein MurJ [Alphaproteobacteria bacterium]|nr:murein biosynthesis integral membrane protein MurJ [Alphaproteobacteria bacterium]